jgi:hypothetical protein
MPRTRTIPDDRVFAAVHALLADGGDKAVSFSAVSGATGLAAPTLVQRYANRQGMLKAARLASWAQRQAATEQAIVATSGKGPQALLKALAPVDAFALAFDQRDTDLVQCAQAWRATVEAALALRLGTGPKARESAALLFAAWQGQALWPALGGGGFKLKDAVKRLT